MTRRERKKILTAIRVVMYPTIIREGTSRDKKKKVIIKPPRVCNGEEREKKKKKMINRVEE